MTLYRPTTTEASADSRLLLFGSQALRFDADTFKRLRSSIWNSPEQLWVTETVASLPDCWGEFIKEFPKFGATESASILLSDMNKWFQSGVMKFDAEATNQAPKLPNIILSPLVVITHIIEYMSFLKTTEASSNQTTGYVLPSATLGLCTGLLSSFVVALSKDRSEIRTYASKAVMLAMLIGGVVDAQERLDATGQATALATAWNGAKAGEELESILQRHPESYISVAYDENRATITTSVRTAARLKKELRAVGIVASEIGLHGRFHHNWYLDDIDSLIRYCDGHPQLSLPDASKIVCPTWAYTGKAENEESIGIVNSGPLHAYALRDILTNTSRWGQTFQSVATVMQGQGSLQVTSFGPERCIPSSAIRKLGIRATHISDFTSASSTTQDVHEKAATEDSPEARIEDDVAIVGMSIKVAGADDVDEFWNLLCEGSSQHKEAPSDRLSFDNVWRDKESSPDPTRKWYGNFINDHDAFDHKFFKKTAREIASTDPQQRHMLQVAYQAVEQSGYFGVVGGKDKKKVGCFIGVCSADYENNVACYQPNAFTAIGNLKSFIAGKISHWFGWLGPSLCIDTACSSSLVAVHQACRAVLSGDCSAALAGGANIMTNSLWFQNLAAASFLSPTGQCKPFDAFADGYCRGEGFAAVYLKKMSRAIADGDQILGTISASAVYQNQNCTPVFVPNAPSLSDLFRDVVEQAQVEPRQITVVEAHGTGTQVGDPAEYESIKNVLGPVTGRQSPLAIGSVKGSIGHTECASGAISLIKTLLMIQHKMIPPQASHRTLNPAVHASPDDKMDVVTRLKPWSADGDFYAALINNYGASGSNASMVVTEAPKMSPAKINSKASNAEHLFRIFGTDERALQAYAQRLGRSLSPYIARYGDMETTQLSADISFNLSRQANPTLDKSLVFSYRTVDQLVQKLDAFVKGVADSKTVLVSASARPPRPVILCFGGQVNTFVGLDQAVYDSSKVLRMHLGRCNAVCETMPDAGSIFPSIFQRTAISDPVKLQASLFAMQYASAQSWIDSGVVPAAVVGHSFGELVAMCISGVFTVHDALKLVIRRATLVRESWGAEKGAMMAIEADLDVVNKVLAAAGGTATIACFNGLRSFTLAGTGSEIDAVAEVLTRSEFTGLRSKRLSVTNAFHSTLVDPLVPSLVDIGRDLTFNEPQIPIERSTEFQWPTDGKLTANYIAQHMRQPVYFNQAIQRLNEQYSSGCIFLEAGSNSTVTVMASRALGSPQHSHFQGLNITGNDGNGVQMLTSATLSLWKEGLRTTFWPHHRCQTYEYKPILLPPYQFEKSRHWMEMKSPPRNIISIEDSNAGRATEEALPLGLFSFVGYQKEDKRASLFRINTETAQYKDLVLGHKIASTAPICPATLIVSMAIEALTSVRLDLSPSRTDWQPQIHQVSNLAPICIDDSRTVTLAFEATGADDLVWNWKITSSNSGKGTAAGTDTLHVTGQLVFSMKGDAKAVSEFKRYDRLTGYHQHCARILDASDADDIIHGARNIYRAFSEVVDYPEPYRGVQRLIGKGDESAGRVVKKASGEEWLDTHQSDSFSQVAGIWVNCMTDCGPDEMYIANGFEKWIRTPVPKEEGHVQSSTWDILARHERVSEKAYISDIFVFDASSGKLEEVILGVNYHKVSKRSMGKILAKLTPGLSVATAEPLSNNKEAQHITIAESNNEVQITVSKPEQTIAVKSQAPTRDVSTPKIDVAGKIRHILADISGLELSEITDDTGLAEIGIDSLMGMELGREMEGAFKTPLMSDELAAVTTFTELVTHVARVLGVSDDDHDQVSVDSTSTSDDRLTDFGSARSHNANTGVTTPAGTESHDLKTVPLSAFVPSSSQELHLSPSMVFEAFEETKRMTDDLIAEYRCAGYMETVLPKQTQLCIALAVEACAQLGCDLRSAKPGQTLQRISHAPEHGRLTEWIYSMLEHEARLIDMSSVTGLITRTAVAAPSKPSGVILADLLTAFPDHEWVNRLAHFAGSRLADVLRGKEDGIKLIFGTEEGRKLVTGLYGDSLLNNLANGQMRDMLTRLVRKLPTPSEGPLKIMELGAGTGGTTKDMVPLLASLGVPIEYTFTDLSGSFVAAARKKYSQQYPFMKFRVHDIEKAPAPELGLQHVVIASNAIHATHNLQQSLSNIRKALRPDGFLLMLEMTEPVYWVDMIFGLFEGWWLFDDGRRHAIAHQTRWQTELQAVGYGRVDWTDGWRPEIEIQRIIVAQASVQPGFSLTPTPMEFLPPAPILESTTKAQQEQLDQYVRQYTKDFTMSNLGSKSVGTDLADLGLGDEPTYVAVTGSTGSLGAHLVAHLASLESVKTVFCLVRYSTTGDPEERQTRAISECGIELASEASAKLKVLVIDATKAQLGLSDDMYLTLSHSVSHIVHNAWPMTGKRPVAGLETQFSVMRNLINLARDATVHRRTNQIQQPTTFEFISSIAVMGHHPLIPGHNRLAPETRAVAEQLLPNGYAHAKWVCERMLDETLHRYPSQFRATSIRPGQIAGNSVSGYWNENEHLSFLIKSSQTLKSLPRLESDMCWTPVDQVAGAAADILLSKDTQMSPVYHIDNPVRQPWSEVLPVLAHELGVPAENIVPFADWVRRVRRFPGSVEDNPAASIASGTAAGRPNINPFAPQQPSTVRAQAPQTSPVDGLDAACQHTGYVAPAKSRFIERHSSAAQARSLGLRLGLANPPRLHAFAYHLGVRKEPESSLQPRLQEMLVWEQARALIDTYISVIHPVFGFLDSDALYHRSYQHWHGETQDLVYEAIVGGVAALGSLFSNQLSEHSEAEIVLQTKTVLQDPVVSRFPCLDLAAGWILRTLYVRATTRPYVAHLSSVVTINLIEVMGLHRDMESTSLAGEVPDDRMKDTELRERTVSVARTLHSVIAFDYGRATINIGSVPCDHIRAGPNDFTLQLASLASVVSRTAAVTCADLSRILGELVEAPSDHDFVTLTKAELCFATYRRLRLLPPGTNESEIQAILEVGVSAIPAARRLATQQLPCLANLGAAMEVLRDINHRFQSKLTAEALNTAQLLVRVCMENKNKELSLLRSISGLEGTENVVTTTTTSPWLDLDLEDFLQPPYTSTFFDIGDFA
ncbi:beta-ketoacyl synthase domain-containing protein [Seiridium cupressi]